MEARSSAAPVNSQAVSAFKRSNPNYAPGRRPRGSSGRSIDGLYAVVSVSPKGQGRSITGCAVIHVAQKFRRRSRAPSSAECDRSSARGDKGRGSIANLITSCGGSGTAERRRCWSWGARVAAQARADSSGRTIRSSRVVSHSTRLVITVFDLGLERRGHCRSGLP